jgi:hypothetical protein
MRRNSKQKKITSTILTINNVDYDLGKLYITTQGYCTANKKNIFTFKCINTGKYFTDINKLSIHLVKYLTEKEIVVLNN